jgi:hypothetical protein
MELLWYMEPVKNRVGFTKHAKSRSNKTLFICDMCYESDVACGLDDGWRHVVVDDLRALREAHEYCFICQWDQIEVVIGPE